MKFIFGCDYARWGATSMGGRPQLRVVIAGERVPGASSGGRRRVEGREEGGGGAVSHIFAVAGSWLDGGGRERALVRKCRALLTVEFSSGRKYK